MSKLREALQIAIILLIYVFAYKMWYEFLFEEKPGFDSDSPTEKYSPRASRFSKEKYFDLALKKCYSGDEWSIHGLWPETSRTKWPQFCDPLRYKECNATLFNEWPQGKKAMMKDWFSCQGDPKSFDNNLKFWKHEWNKHGTCSCYIDSRLKSQKCRKFKAREFFETTLLLFRLSSDDIGRCCDSRWQSCLLAFSKDLKYLGRCHFL